MSVIDKVKEFKEIENKREIKPMYEQCMDNLKVMKNKNDVKELNEILEFVLDQCFEGNLNAYNFNKIRAHINGEKSGSWKTSEGGNND